MLLLLLLLLLYKTVNLTCTCYSHRRQQFFLYVHGYVHRKIIILIGFVSTKQQDGGILIFCEIYQQD